MPRPTTHSTCIINGTTYDCWWFDNDPDAVFIRRSDAPQGKTTLWGRTTHSRGRTDDGRRWFVEG